MESQIQTIEHIAKFIKNGDIPKTVRPKAIECLIDYVSACYIGTSHPSYKKLLNSNQIVNYTQGNSFVFGEDKLYDYKTAAFLNGTVGHIADYDDTSYEGNTHPTATLFPAILAIGQEMGISGDKLLCAYIIGMEVHMAFGRALTNDFYHAGNWTSAALGNLGATAGVCKVLELEEPQIIQALSISFGTTYGLRSLHGSPMKPIVIGRISRESIENGLLAKNNLGAKTITLDGMFGLINVHNNGIFKDSEFTKLGNFWSVRDTGLLFKLYPICSGGQAACEAVHTLKDKHQINHQDIINIKCEVTKLAYESMFIDRPISPQECQFSLKYSIACMAIDNEMTYNHLDAKHIQRDDLANMISKIDCSITTELDDDPNAPEGSIITIVTNKGQYRMVNGCAVGMPNKPFSESQRKSKFVNCCQGNVSNYEAIYNNIVSLESINNIKDLFAV